jgi:energy-coupling factor transporter ATP-binding protein EcfA2
MIRESSGDYVEAIVTVKCGDNQLQVSVLGDEIEASTIIDYLKSQINSSGYTLIYTATGIKGGNLLQATGVQVFDGTVNLARDSFYPWLPVKLQDYFNAYMAANESVLLLLGPPGTGKSTFLRSLIMSGRYTSLVAYNAEVVQSSILIDDFYENEDLRILAYEDVDNYLGTRKDGNSLMSHILNAVDGVTVHRGKKIVFSTNLDTLSKIDPALLRVGRCFDILTFEELTATQADAVIEDLGWAPRDFSHKPKWLLAEVLSQSHAVQQTINRFGRKVGFSGS